MDSVLLGAYASTRCPRRVHNDFDRTIDVGTQPLVRSSVAQERIEAGRDFEVQIYQTLRDLHGPDVVTIDPAANSVDAVELTLAAMTDGVSIVLGGWLPNDAIGGRKGRPDILLRGASLAQTGSLPGGSRPDPKWGYVPVDVKNHKTLNRANHAKGEAVLSSLERPAYSQAVGEPDYSVRRNRSEVDMLQLAHYWRMLQACGFASPGGARAGVIGSDQIESVHPELKVDDHVITWFDLEAPVIGTFSSSSPTGKAMRSAMDRYDHEFSFRLDIASVALQRLGVEGDPEPLVDPIWVAECTQCPWQEYCAQQLGPESASLAVGRLSARQWGALAQLGVSTVDELGALDADRIAGFVSAEVGQTEGAETPPLQRPQPDTAWVASHGLEAGASAGRLTTDEVLGEYLPQFADPSSAQRSLAKAVRSAQMSLAGVYLQRSNSVPIEPIRADIELHVDIESDRGSRVYLWGIYVVDNICGTARYESLATWNPVDDVSEARLAMQFWRYLVEAIDEATGKGQSLRVYHYAKPEPNAVMKLAKAAVVPGAPSVSTAKAVIDECFVDLFTTVRSNYYGRKSLGLKDVAHYGAGFSWRDEDPGGAQSQIWLEQVYGGDESAITRILRYNEDDVRATDAVLNWLDTPEATAASPRTSRQLDQVPHPGLLE